ncbi:acetolactate synthase catalytic subunit [Achromobacter deleyi]|uniref:acetolactate synthase catalytic subunit n=1 Tax=Achromobacter deleyi TaxID=1353891 RepID=UPI001491AF00|nr:acetolactate synthase catalytic subunit [Achromobacter deleyi]QVQ26411.1 acetolactate synthase catalytic subunit [Achromobacter deleyi]UIP21977.1 acetolactate synthase catalytic subunit [Achromobacter deleyi]
MTGPLTKTGFTKENTVAHVLANALKKHGITHFFGQSLPSMFVLAAEQIGIKQVSYRTENAGGYMADAYARMSNKPAIVTAQNGPAAALLVAPLAEAQKVSIPVIALIQDVNRDQHDKNAFQDLDHIAMLDSVCKWVRRIDQASRVEDYIDQAFVAATSGRPGPVALLLPADLLQEQAVTAAFKRTVSLGHFPLDRPVANPQAMEQAVALLAAAKRPVIVGGGGVHVSQAAQELVDFADAMSIPLATTNMGKGIIADSHELALGVIANCLGPNGSGRYLKPFVSEADVVLLVGNRTNQNGTDSWALYPKSATYIHLDIDPQEIGRNYEAQVRLVGDAKTTLQAMAQLARGASMGARQAARKDVVAGILRGRDRHQSEVAPLLQSNDAPIRPERIMAELDALLSADDTVVADASYSTLWVTNYLKVRKCGQRFLTPRGLAGLGWGMPMAMGARVANETGTTYCLVGDGGFGHVWSEMETAARMGIKVVTILINNSILGYQKHAECLKYGSHTTAVNFAPVDHSAVARAAGLNGVRVTDPAKIREALQQAAQSDKGTLIEVICTDQAYPPITFYSPEALV